MLEKLAGPVIGALIGYCTNFIAVKMLFYPKKEIRIGGHKLPFTPGAIPKGKPRLAKAIGNIVAKELLTEDDIRKKLISQETQTVVIQQIVNGLSQTIHSDIEKAGVSEESYEKLKGRLSSVVSDQILDSVTHMDLEKIIVEEAQKAIQEKTKGSMLNMFLNDGMITSIIQPIGSGIVRYINEKGPDFIKAEIESKIDTFFEGSVLDFCGNLKISEEAVQTMAASLYQKAVDAIISKFIGTLDISGMIEEKINEMDVDSLEKMVMTVMKKELDTIVNLGALVGAVLGILNIFI